MSRRIQFVELEVVITDGHTDYIYRGIHRWRQIPPDAYRFVTVDPERPTMARIPRRYIRHWLDDWQQEIRSFKQAPKAKTRQQEQPKLF